MIYNARITSTFLGIEDHGIMTFMLNLSFDGSGIGYGGYCLDQYANDKREGHGHSYQAIRRLLETIGVTKWEDLPNKLCRIEYDEHHILRIGHILDNHWFDLRSYMASIAD